MTNTISVTDSILAERGEFLLTARNVFDTVLSGDVDAYAALRAGLTKPSGGKSARRDVTLNLIQQGVIYADANVQVAKEQGTSYREVAAALMLDAGLKRADVAQALSTADVELADGTVVKGKTVTDGRVTQLARVGAVIIRVGAPSGYTLAELKRVCGGAGSSAIGELLASNNTPAQLQPLIAKAVANGIKAIAKGNADRAEKAAKEEAERQERAQEQTAANESTTLDGSRTTDDTATEPADETDEDVIVTDETDDNTPPKGYGEDVARLLSQIGDVVKLAQVVGSWDRSKMSKRSLSQVQSIVDACDTITVALTD